MSPSRPTLLAGSASCSCQQLYVTKHKTTDPACRYPLDRQLQDKTSRKHLLRASARSREASDATTSPKRTLVLSTGGSCWLSLSRRSLREESFIHSSAQRLVPAASPSFARSCSLLWLLSASGSGSVGIRPRLDSFVPAHKSTQNDAERAGAGVIAHRIARTFASRRSAVPCVRTYSHCLRWLAD